MDKLGHSESNSFSFELETALAEALEEAYTILTPQIIEILMAHPYFTATWIILISLSMTFLLQVRFTPATG